MHTKYVEMLFNWLVQAAMQERAQGRYIENHPIEQALHYLEQDASKHCMIFRTRGNSPYFQLVPTDNSIEKRRYILVVGRDHTVNNVLSLVLAQAGYEVATTDDVCDIVLLAQSHTPDLIIYDLDTMALDCIDLLIANIPQLAMTSAYVPKCKSCIMKPFTQQQLMQAIEHIFHQRGAK